MGRRVVTVVLDAPRGALPTFTVATPWWQEAETVVDAVRERFGIDVVVLRLLEGEEPHASPVTYLAELVGGVPPRLEPWSHEIADDPLRLPYARPGGPAADVAWAATVVELVGAPVQVRTWNLSSIWRLPTTCGTVWLKHVPPFFAHEPRVLAHLAAWAPVPRLLAHDGARMLLAHVSGEEGYELSGAPLDAMVDALVDLQAASAGRVGELLALGLPDWRAPAFVTDVRALVARYAAVAGLDELVDALDDRFAALETCGVPDTIVHGDFFPGNVRWTDHGPVILDWGDCGVGCPLLDLAAFLDRAADDPARLRRHWLARWRRVLRRADVERAAALAAPIAALRQALVYQRFLDGIEATERVYHRDDVGRALARAVSAAAEN